MDVDAAVIVEVGVAAIAVGVNVAVAGGAVTLGHAGMFAGKPAGSPPGGKT